MKKYFLTLAVICFSQVKAEDIFKGCIDLNGRSVNTVYNNSLNNIAYATITPAKKPIIIINSKAIASLSTAMQKFAYWHECGHISLGHLIQQKQAAIIEEQAADCFGVRVPLTLGLIKHSELPKLQSELSKLGSGDFQHFAGGTRAINIEKCLGDGYAEENWNSCKTKFYSNIEFINKSFGIVAQLLAGCRSKGFKNPDCIKAKELAAQLNDGLLKTVGEIDEQYPYVMAPAFNKAIANYSQALFALLHSK
jgi:hypothetical protein